MHLLFKPFDISVFTSSVNERFAFFNISSSPTVWSKRLISRFRFSFAKRILSIIEDPKISGSCGIYAICFFNQPGDNFKILVSSINISPFLDGCNPRINLAGSFTRAVVTRNIHNHTWNYFQRNIF